MNWEGLFVERFFYKSLFVNGYSLLKMKEGRLKPGKRAIEDSSFREMGMDKIRKAGENREKGNAVKSKIVL